ncbi:hypothetical protein IWQ56_003977 [Coemansia nantahalensis]|uniref:Uncharacterized protein n=2 Tax=Coemansia TaxID=4863 RepID=A0ACC1L5Z8_9FUNG|nr:hypothetical protein IWQ57_006353 [Coemansia nantahalensis]KAJ2765744.1 hypothetical protein IWQ56_003977 [Coemansia nantahalensis]KAJ2801567.1 hypothetical protein H4R21_002752 [Coemansia helicoidea]
MDTADAASGVRHHKLLSVLDRSLSAVVGTLSLEALQEVFPDLAREIPGKLADSHDQLGSYIRNSANADFQAILMQYDMEAKLTGLDGLVKDAATRKQTLSDKPIPSLSPESINRNRSAAIKRAELARLRARLAQVKEENARLLAEVGEQRAALAAEHERLDKTMALARSIDAE